METLISILIVIGIVALVIWIAPFLLTAVAILVIAVMIYGIYAKHKIKKQMEDMDTYQRYEDDDDTSTYYRSSSTNDDIIDVEFTESVDDRDD